MSNSFCKDEVPKELCSSPKEQEDQNLFSLALTSCLFQEKVMALVMIQFTFQSNHLVTRFCVRVEFLFSVPVKEVI